MAFPLIIVAAAAVAAALIARGSGDSGIALWSEMRNYRPKPVPDSSQGVVGGDRIQGGSPFSFQEMITAAVPNGYRIYVPNGSTADNFASNPKILVLKEPKPGVDPISTSLRSEFRLLFKPGDKIPALTGSVPGAPPIQIPGAPAPAPAPAPIPIPPPGGSAPSPQGPVPGTPVPPRPDWWPPGVPWPPPVAQIPSPDSPRPEWWPPNLPWPPQIPGAPGPAPAPAPAPGTPAPPSPFPFPLPIPGGPTAPTVPQSDEEIAVNAPPGGEPFRSVVELNSTQLGGVDRIRSMAAETATTSPAVSRWLTACANIAERKQRAASVARGGTAFTVQRGHIPDLVSQHYGGTLSELRATNPGRSVTSNSDWNVGRTWLLPLAWNAEIKPLPRQMSAAAKVSAPVAKRAARSTPATKKSDPFPGPGWGGEPEKKES